MADNVINFPGLRKLLDTVQAPGRWADEHGAAEAREGLARPFVSSIKADHPEMSDEAAANEARKYSGLAEQGGMTIGSLGSNEARALSAGPGIEGIGQAQDLAKMLPATESAGAAASRQIIGAEHNNIKELAKQLAAKRQPRWGN